MANTMEKAKTKKPISHDKIYKMMLGVTIAVSVAFLIINVIKANTAATIVIGACLVLFVGSHTIMMKRNVPALRREFALSASLCVLVFIISLFSGESYSDDFSLFLAVIGMTGLYLEPKFTKIQIVESNILLKIGRAHV